MTKFNKNFHFSQIYFVTIIPHLITSTSETWTKLRKQISSIPGLWFVISRCRDFWLKSNLSTEWLVFYFTFSVKTNDMFKEIVNSNRSESGQSGASGLIFMPQINKNVQPDVLCQVRHAEKWLRPGEHAASSMPDMPELRTQYRITSIIQSISW